MTPDLPTVEMAIVQMTNDFRTGQKVGAVKRDKLLDKIARNYARYLARTGKFSHHADGRSISERAKSGGYSYCAISENLSMNFDSRGFRSRQLARDAMNGWKNSPGHRRNLLAPASTEIGVGVAKAADTHRYLSVQVFGRPAARRFSFRLRNTTGMAVTYTYGRRQHRLPGRSQMTHTVCQPGKLTFPDLARSDAKTTTPARYTTQPGDRFIIQRTPAGKLRVDHQPQL